MNVYDSARMADVLAPLGYRPVDRPDDADMVILNTCHIREKASEKVFSELGRLRALKARKAAGGGRMVLAVAGCVGQAEGAEIMARAPYVDLVFGPQTFHRLPELVTRADGHPGGVLDIEFPAESKFDFLPEEQTGQGLSAFLAVQEGCDKFCTFCVVPYTRGAEFSRPAGPILAEARRLIHSGARAITLLGQNVNAWHGEAPAGGGRHWGLGRLVRAVAELDGLLRLRYTTSHPGDMDDDLMSAHGEVPGLMPFVHLPVQSGSDGILVAMNRRHTVDDYRRRVDRLRHFRADLALSSDFIVGFPGESDADFAATLGLVEQVGYAQAYSFKYSPRPGTPAAELDRQVPETVRDERLTALQALLNRQQLAFNRAAVGSVMPVLFDRPGRRPGQMLGRSPFMQAVHVAGDDALSGRLAEVRILAGHPNSLSGCLVGRDGAPVVPEDAPRAPEVIA